MLTPQQVHRRTGFCDRKRLLSYVAISMCNGDFEKMISTTTTMTCIEERVLFLEYTYGRRKNRWEDYVDDWNLRDKSLRMLLNNKLEQELQTRIPSKRTQSPLGVNELRKPFPIFQKGF
jgi:hypothetical protein